MGFEVDGVHFPQLHRHEQTAQLRCLLTTLYDKNAHPSEWVFTANRVSRYVHETNALQEVGDVDDLCLYTS